MSDEFVTFSLRIPKPLHDKLKRMAHEQHRTLNGQVAMILESAAAPKMKAEKR